MEIGQHIFFILLDHPIFTIAGAVIVYFDCQLNSRNGIIWAIFVYLTGLWGLLAYFILYTDTLKTAALRLRGINIAERVSSPVSKSVNGISDEDSLLPFSDLIYTDPKLDEIFKRGDMDEARRYLDNVYKVADEMGDSETRSKYKKYEDRFTSDDSNPEDWLVQS